MKSRVGCPQRERCLKPGGAPPPHLVSQGDKNAAVALTARLASGLWQQTWVLFQAFHLIKAVSVLLNFSQEEENMLKETLEYKVSFPGLPFPLLDEVDQAVERTTFSLMFFPLSPPDFVHHSISLMALSQLLQL